MTYVKTLAIDFDGVLHAYSRGWEDGVIYDEPVAGSLDAVRDLAGRFRLVVFTARENLLDVKVWLRKHGFDTFIEDVTNRKPAAAYYIDDRAVHFTSWLTAREEIAFREEDARLDRPLDGRLPMDEGSLR